MAGFLLFDVNDNVCGTFITSILQGHVPRSTMYCTQMGAFPTQAPYFVYTLAPLSPSDRFVMPLFTCHLIGINIIESGIEDASWIQPSGGYQMSAKNDSFLHSFSFSQTRLGQESTRRYLAAT